MTSPASSASRVLFESLRPVRRRPICECLSYQTSNRKSPRLRRDVSTVTAHRSEMEVDGPSHPRWSQTPTAMKGTVKPRFWKKEREGLKINNDPRKLDDVYMRFLGKDGDKLLSEETKWLAVTHKSFDHGRRGFNDRLAFLGKRIYELQTTLALLSLTESSRFLKNNEDPHGREPFLHPALDAVECLNGGARAMFTHHKAVAKVAVQYGISDIVRWVPKIPENLSACGADLVYAQAVYAILGGLALEQGSAIANHVAKERILRPLRTTLGVKTRGQGEIEDVKL